MRKGGGGREEEVEQEATANEYSLAIPAYQSSKSALDLGWFFNLVSVLYRKENIDKLLNVTLLGKTQTAIETGCYCKALYVMSYM